MIVKIVLLEIDILAKYTYTNAMTKRSEKKFITYCTSNHLRLTPPRLSAFKILQKAKKPITAYEVLDLMGNDIKNPKPPTAYRALEFLTQHGFAHRIESLNSYISCDSDHKHKGSQFTICDSCGNVGEIHLCDIPDTLQEAVCSQGFCTQYWNIEVHGKCAKCCEKNPDCCDDKGCSGDA